MKKINIAVIGCGRIAGHHCKNINMNSNYNLVAVCDLNEERMQAASKEYKTLGYLNYRTMLSEHPEIDLVSIITPSGIHYEHALEILTKYRKSIVVEKPTFLKLSHFDEIYQTAQKLGLNVFAVFQNRYNKAVQKVKKALETEELGKPQIMTVRVRWCRPQRYYDLSAWRGTFAMDGGAITNQGVHHIDLLRYLGVELTEVKSIMSTFGADIEVEDTCVSTLKFANGALGTLEITTSARPDDFEASISILGSKGLAQIGGIAVNELQIYTPDKAQQTLHSEDFSNCVYGNGHECFYNDVADHILHQKKYFVDYTEAKKSLSLLHSFYVSNETGTAINPGESKESKNLGRSDEKLADLYRTKD
jgi:UDP-N-acetyl-2-amino-2-deoxyglucuronate dehydrogenase